MSEEQPFLALDSLLQSSLQIFAGSVAACFWMLVPSTRISSTPDHLARQWRLGHLAGYYTVLS